MSLPKIFKSAFIPIPPTSFTPTAAVKVFPKISIIASVEICPSAAERLFKICASNDDVSSDDNSPLKSTPFNALRGNLNL